MSKVKDTFFGGAEKRAGRKLAEAQAAAGRLSAAQLAQTESEFAPFLGQEAGPSLQQQQALSGALGPEAQAQAFQGFQESPGVQFAREQGLRGINTGFAATGGLGGGERLRELTKFSQGLALQDLSNQFNRLGVTSSGEQALIGRQQSATAQLGSLRAGLGAQQGSALIGEGQAKSAGITGSAAGLRTGVQDLGKLIAAGVASDRRLKDNITKIGTMENGLNWYSWDWKDDFDEITAGMPTEGVIAQEAQKVFPAAVTSINGVLHVDYTRLH